MTIADLKADFSSILAQVHIGESSTKNRRVLGTYEGKASFSEQGDGKITLEEFLGEE